MRRFFLILLCCMFYVQVYSQNSPEEDYFQRLYNLCKVWGYAKYFHPQVADCQVEWDDILLRVLDETKRIGSNSDFNHLLLGMLESAGEVPSSNGEAPKVAEELGYNLNLKWMDSGFFSEEVRARLHEIRDNFRPQDHCLLNSFFENGNLNFSADRKYYGGTEDFVEEPLRLLALFRYWNIINYFFPYKYQMDQDWDITLQQVIPPIVMAGNAEDYHLAFKEFTAYINDTHASFRSFTYLNWSGFYIPPFRVRTIEGKIVITTVHHSVRDQLKVGDIVLEMDGKTIENYRNELKKYIAGSNEVAISRELNTQILNGEAGSFRIVVENENGQKELNLVRRHRDDYLSMFQSAGESIQNLTTSDGCEVGYVDMGKLLPHEVQLVFSSFTKLPAIIFDLRNYPNSTLWEIVNYLYPGPVNLAAITNPDPRFPGTFKYNQHTIGEGGTPYQGKLILLFDENTQSQAEFTIMGLEQHPGALKAGSQTAGADGNVSEIYLPGNIRTGFSGLGIFYPDGTETQRIGIVPDQEILPTIQGTREGRDELLDFVLDCNIVGAGGVNVYDEATGVDIFPNPFQDKLSIRSNLNRNYKIILTDISGRFLQGFRASPNQFIYSLDLEGLAKGLYFLRFEDEKGTITTKKLLKM